GSGRNCSGRTKFGSRLTWARAGASCAHPRGAAMSIIAKLLIALVALEHVYFLVLEMFLWTTPRTRAAFGMSAEQAEQTKVLAGNQGLYNGFLAAGLAWSLIAPAAYATQLALFFLGWVIVAVLYGGYWVGKRILRVQVLPAAIALAAVLFAGR